MSLVDIPPLSSTDFGALFNATPSDQDLLLELLDPHPAPWSEPNSAGIDSPLLGATPTGFDGSTIPAFSPTGLWDDLLVPLPEIEPALGIAADSMMLPPLVDTHGSAGASGSLGGTSGSVAGGSGAPAGTGARRRGRSRKELSEEQKERIRAKNRRAQNRYREKQKAKMSATEQEYEDTAAELERARLENLHLREREVTMQQVLSVRDFAMNLLLNSKAVDDAAVQGLPCGCLSPDKCSCHKGDTLEGGVVKLLSTPGSLALVPHSGAQRPGEAPACPLTGLSLSQVEELKEAVPDSLQQSWKSIVQRLEVILQQLNALKRSEGLNLSRRAKQLEAQLHDTLLEGQFFCFEHALYKPANVQRLFAAVLDESSQTSIADERHWERVTAALQLTCEQVDQLAAARSAFLAGMGEVCVERRKLLGSLAALQVPPAFKVLQQINALWLEVQEATANLSANLAREHNVCMTFMRDAFAYALTPHQKAVAAVRSFPFFPDMLAIATVAMHATGALHKGLQP